MHRALYLVAQLPGNAVVRFYLPLVVEPQQVHEGPAEAAAVVHLEFGSLEEEQHTEDLGVARGSDVRLFAQAALKVGDAGAHRCADGSRVGVGGTRLVDQAALHGLVGTNEGIEGFPQIGIYGFRLRGGGKPKRLTQELTQEPVFFEEAMGDLHLGIRDRFRVKLREFLTLARFAEELTIVGTADGLLPLPATADGANGLVASGAPALWFARLTDGAAKGFGHCSLDGIAG